MKHSEVQNFNVAVHSPPFKMYLELYLTLTKTAHFL